MYEPYIDFIRYAIHSDLPVPEGADRIDWADFLGFCIRQGVIGLVFDGLERSELRIPQMTLFEWIGFAENNKQQNAIANKRVTQVCKFFAEKECRCVLLKGPANGLMYPKPELRSPGDIDLWCEGKDVDIIKLVLKECPEAKYSLHHVKMPVFDDVAVEVHYRPIFLPNWFKDKKLQKFIVKVQERQFENLNFTLDVNGIGVLTSDFDVVYQLLHMWHHFFENRNNFKQMIDYFFLLKKCHKEPLTGLGAITDRTELVGLLKELGVLKYAKGMMWVMKEVLGLEEKYLYTEPDEKIGKLILNETMVYGTFSQNRLKEVLQQFVGNLRLLRAFPSEVIISPIYLVWHQWWKLKMKWKLDKN